MEPRLFRAPTVDLAFAEGPDSGPPAVLLHGLVRRWQDFEPILNPLTSRFHVHALDFRGHGASGRTPGAYRVVDYVADVVAFVEERIAGSVVLVGHSLGAMVAAAVASTVPDRIRGVILEDPPFEMMGRRIGETSYLGLFRAYRNLLKSTDSETGLAAGLAEVRLSTPGDDRSVRLGDQRSTDALRWLAACLRQIDPETLTPVITGQWLDGFDLDRILPRIACPVLFLQADPSAGGTLPDDYATRLAEAIPRVQLVRMAGVGHNIHATHPEAMTRLMSGFFDILK